MKQLNIDKLDYLTVRILKKLGNRHPKKEHVNLLKSLLSTTEIPHSLAFDSHLTPGEIACLFLAAKGKTSLETAKLMELKLCTIETFRRRIKHKLDCKSFVQAVYKGVQLGYLAQKWI